MKQQEPYIDNEGRTAPAMSRCHFEYLADWLSETPCTDELAYDLADWLARTNPRFDVARFIKRADPDQEPKT